MLSAWLKDALVHSGLSQAELARQLSAALKRGDDRSVVGKMLKGKRRISASELIEIARITGHPAPVDLPENFETVHVVGYVGAGSAAHLFAESQGPFDEVRAPEGSTQATVAVEIRGESLGPVFDRWLVFYDDVRDPPTSDLIGKLCVVGLADGRVLVKQLKAGQLARHFNLISTTEPPIYDAVVDWAARVKQMSPRA